MLCTIKVNNILLLANAINVSSVLYAYTHTFLNYCVLHIIKIYYLLGLHL